MAAELPAEAGHVLLCPHNCGLTQPQHKVEKMGPSLSINSHTVTVAVFLGQARTVRMKKCGNNNNSPQKYCNNMLLTQLRQTCSVMAAEAGDTNMFLDKCRENI